MDGPARKVNCGGGTLEAETAMQVVHLREELA